MVPGGSLPSSGLSFPICKRTDTHTQRTDTHTPVCVTTDTPGHFSNRVQSQDLTGSAGRYSNQEVATQAEARWKLLLSQPPPPQSRSGPHPGFESQLHHFLTVGLSRCNRSFYRMDANKTLAMVPGPQWAPSGCPR